MIKKHAGKGEREEEEEEAEEERREVTVEKSSK